MLTQIETIRKAILLLAGLTWACGDFRNGGAAPDLPTPELAHRLSSEYSARIGDGLGNAVEGEARFLGSQYVLFLDKFSPHLRLFTADGHRLWTGGRAGGGPEELAGPQAVAVSGVMVLVFQRGRISRWVLDGDSLRFLEPVTLPVEYFPLGAVSGCDGNWLLFARNDKQLPGGGVDMTAPAARMELLFSLKLTDGKAEIEPLWGTAPDQSAAPYSGKAAAMIGRTGSTIAVLHRPNPWVAGQLLEFDCTPRLLHAYSEHALATGDSAHVLIPRSRALQWTSGIVAIPDGLIVAMHRYFAPGFHDVTEPMWKTEVFRFMHGEYQGSIVIEGQWMLMDHDPGLGVLMSSNDPLPHFIRIPEAALAPERGGL